MCVSVQVIGAYGELEEGPVSCWRSIFVANEFTELSALRRTQPALTFILLVRLLCPCCYVALILVAFAATCCISVDADLSCAN